MLTLCSWYFKIIENYIKNKRLSITETNCQMLSWLHQETPSSSGAASQDFISGVGGHRLQSEPLVCGPPTHFQNIHIPYAFCWTGPPFTCTTLSEFNPIPGGGGGLSLRPPSGFSCAIAKRLKIFSSYLVTFPSYSLRIIHKKKCRVRSGQVTRAGLVTPPQKSLQSRQIRARVFFTQRFLLFRCLLHHQYV